MAEETITERMYSQQHYEVKLKELKMAEKKVEREYNLEMKKLKLWGHGLSLPGDHVGTFHISQDGNNVEQSGEALNFIF